MGDTGLLILEVFLFTHNDASQSVGLLWASDQLVAGRPLPDNTQHSQQANIHGPGGIRTHDLSRRAATETDHLPYSQFD